MKYVLLRHIPTGDHGSAAAIRGDVITPPEHHHHVFRSHDRRPIDFDQRIKDR
jgi:hypothetical protein